MPLGDLIQSATTKRAGPRLLPILSMTMHEGLVDQRAKFKKRVASSDTSDYKVVQRGQLVVGFPIDEGVLAFQQLYDEAVVSPAYDVWNIRDDTAVAKPYLERFLRSPEALSFYRSKLRSTTARRRTLPRDTFLALPIPLPALDEQLRVVAILEEADALRSKRRAAIAKLDELLQAIFYEMFGDPVTNPRGWPVRPLGSVVRQGTIVTYGIVQAGPEVPSGIPYIRTGDLVGGEIKTEGLRHTAPEIAARFARSRVDPGDIVMSIRATVGTTAVVPKEVGGANLTQGTARIAPGAEAIGEYLLGAIRTAGTQRWIQRQVKGATFREITLKRLRELPIVLPPAELQYAYRDHTRAINAVRQSHASGVSAADDLFCSLQERAFRGEL